MCNDVKSKRYLNSLIDSFGLSIRLRMICRECQHRYVHLSSDSDPEIGHEFGVPVTNDSSWHTSMVTNEGSDCYAGSGRRISGILAGDKQDALSELASDSEQSVVSILRDG